MFAALGTCPRPPPCGALWCISYTRPLLCSLPYSGFFVCDCCIASFFVCTVARDDASRKTASREDDFISRAMPPCIFYRYGLYFARCIYARSLSRAYYCAGHYRPTPCTPCPHSSLATNISWSLKYRRRFDAIAPPVFSLFDLSTFIQLWNYFWHGCTLSALWCSRPWVGCGAWCRYAFWHTAAVL